MTSKRKSGSFVPLTREQLHELVWEQNCRQTGDNRASSSFLAERLREKYAPRPEGPEGPEARNLLTAGSPGEPLLQASLVSDSADPATPPNLLTLPVRQRTKPGRGSCGASNTATPSQVRDTAGRISIDWLSVYQYHPEAPKLGDSVILFCDLESGEVRSECVKGLQHRGSHDSALQIRCDGRRVEVSGNPSKWGRFDNVYGHATIGRCIEVYNEVLRSLGLPEFCEDERIRVSPFQFQRSDAVAPAGPVITRVDLCRNWQAGSASDSRTIVNALSSVVRMGRAGWLSPDGCTVAWGVGSRYVYTKYYLKGPELRKHPGADPEYTAQLADWCDTVGLVRQEVSFKSMHLKRNGLDRPGAWDAYDVQGGTVDLMSQLLDEYSPHRETGAACDNVRDLYSTMVEAGLPKSRARAAQVAAEAYRNGFRFNHDPKKGPVNISRSAFYRLKADVALCGIDIAAPLNVAALPVRIRTVELSPAVAPDWYRWAG